jgi:diguanylate cyclase (GGDEF)-like protein
MDQVKLGARSVARAMVSEPLRYAAVFWAGSVVLVASLLCVMHWSPLSSLALSIITGVDAAFFALRAVAGTRLRFWTLHLDLAAGTVMTGILVAVGASEHLDFSAFFLWITLFAALYFRPLVLACTVAAAMATDAIALFFGPSVNGAAVTWFVLLATMLVVAGTAYGLVSTLRHSASEDGLTGLPNRRCWNDRLEEELERSRRTRAAVSMLMIDLDNFKLTNDQMGHAAGDQLLQDLACAWRPVVRGGGDFLARIGGDEFAVLAPGSDELGIRRLADRLVDVLPTDLKCSVGTATWDRLEGHSDLMRRADQKMYEAKLSHRNHESARGI